MPEPKRQHPLGGYGGWSFLLPRRAYIPRRRLRQPTKQPLSRPTGPHPSSRRSQCGCRLSSRMACIATRSPLGSSEASTCSGGKLMMFRSEPAAAFGLGHLAQSGGNLLWRPAEVHQSIVDVLVQRRARSQQPPTPAGTAAFAVAFSGQCGFVAAASGPLQLTRHRGGRTAEQACNRTQAAAVPALDHDHGTIFGTQVVVGSGHGNARIWGRCTWKLSLSCYPTVRKSVYYQNSVHYTTSAPPAQKKHKRLPDKSYLSLKSGA